ncbi:MAG: alpha/beta hydrolase [Micrococcales bacterium]|nr:alpha/beta hydrolase [Micrococcales bacterium]MCL2668687.1 alpha/beta hydrolase [Micrococcales bacterium]
MHGTRRQLVRGRIAAVAACAALAAAGCASSSGGSATVDPDATKAPPGLEQYYSQTLSWAGCGEDPAFSSGVSAVDTLVKLASLECAWLQVPMDYAKPGGETIQLAVARSVVPGSQGSVVVNPGGPGGSGVDFVSSFADGAGDKLTSSLDVVSFDPRGVGRSAPVDCLDTADLDAFLALDIDTTTPAGLARAQTVNRDFGAACLERTGPVLAYVDTVSAARDMDVLRAALREPTLTYVGISYGTKLGATYAQLFPERAGRMVLDGAVDPTIPAAEETVAQIGGFESAMRAYVTDCLAGASCPLSGSVDDAMGQIVDVVEQAQKSPLPTGSDRKVTGALAMTGIITPLYDSDMWFLLTTALSQAIDDGDGTMLLLLADNYAGRCDGFTCPFEDGYYSNLLQAHFAIGCVDDRLDIDPQVLAKEVMAAAPILGRLVTSDMIDSCADWPVPLVGPLDSYEAKGAPPIVVIGTTNDPATPYAWAQSLAKTLDSGVLVTFEGEGHAAYLRGTECVQTAVDDFVVDGKVPKDGLMC